MIRALAFVLALLWPAAAATAPIIDNVVAPQVDGDTLTINGSGFGTHALTYNWIGGINGVINTAPNLTRTDSLWFATGNPQGKGWRTWISSGRYAPYNDCNTPRVVRSGPEFRARTNRSASIRTKDNCAAAIASGFVYSPRNSPGSAYWPANPTFTMTEVYIAWWMYADPVVWDTSGSPPATTTSQKVFRLNSTGWLPSCNDYVGEFYSVQNYHNVTGAGNVHYIHNYCSCASCPAPGCPLRLCQGIQRYPSWFCWDQFSPCDAKQTRYSTNAPAAFQWVFTELYVKQASGVEIADGRFHIRTLPTTGSVGSYQDDTIWTKGNPAYDGCQTDYTPLEWHRFGFQNWWRGGLARFYYDDIYIQWGTRAHVVVGNDQDYAACTQLEVQPPTAWAAGQIKVVFNQGSFSQDADLWVFVVDENGNPSNGLALACP